MDVRLVAFDLDGTILKGDKTISEKTREALLRAAERGIVLVPTTGRFHTGMPAEVRALPFRYMIGGNGAEVRDVRQDTVLYAANIGRVDAESILGYMLQLPAICGYYQNGRGWMSPEDHARLKEYTTVPGLYATMQAIYSPMENVRAEIFREDVSVQKLQAYFKSLAEKEHALADMLVRFPGYAISTSLPNNIEVNAAAATKGLALEYLCAYLGIPQASCMAIGDGTNDTSMIMFAGVGVAMGNAAREVLHVADIVTATNEEDGVAEALLPYLE